MKKCKRDGSRSVLFMVQLSCFYVEVYHVFLAFGVFSRDGFGSFYFRTFTSSLGSMR